MNSRLSPFRATTALIAAACVAGTSCRKARHDEGAGGMTAPAFVPDLENNGLAAMPGAVYHSQVRSPIHWQPWTPETMQRAKAAKRLVFAVIALPQQPGYNRVLAELARDPDLVAVINDYYVPVLIDGDASREAGLLTADLCSEIKRPLQLPLFVWMTPDANPVAWIPVPNSPDLKLSKIFNQSHSMVARSWLDDPAYIAKNSALDNASRRERLSRRKNLNMMSEQPAQDAIRAIRQLASFYDPSSRTFDEAGGLFPAGAIDLMSTAAMHPGVPADVRGRCLDTTRELLVDLLSSAMFDPLEGGVFSSRRNTSWALPMFCRDCVSQCRAAVALFNAYTATKNPRALEKALDLIAFAEKNFKTSEGLFAVGVTDESPPSAWLWNVEEIDKALPAEDAAWWIRATGMKGLGNLPSEADTRREYFRSNSIGLGKSVAELAAEAHVAPEAFAPRFESVRKTLLKMRNARLGDLARDDCSHAGATLRMVSAYAAAFSATGEMKFRDKAVDLLEKARNSFADRPGLRLFSKPSPPSIGEGRAFLYGLALQSALDVSTITSDHKWLDWAEDLATTAAERFTAANFLKECPDDAKICDVPVTDLVMLFDDSTAGLISFAECRLAQSERPLVSAFSDLATPLPTYSVDRPILHTDLLQATLARHFWVTVIPGTNLAADMKLAVERLPMRMVQRRAAKSSDEVPSGSVKVVFFNGESHLVSNPRALEEAILPSAPKS